MQARLHTGAFTQRYFTQVFYRLIRLHRAWAYKAFCYTQMLWSRHTSKHSDWCFDTNTSTFFRRHTFNLISNDGHTYRTHDDFRQIAISQQLLRIETYFAPKRWKAQQRMQIHSFETTFSARVSKQNHPSGKKRNITSVSTIETNLVREGL